MTSKQRIETLRELAEADAAGDGSAHNALLREIRSLQQTVETPIETTSRLNFQVRSRFRQTMVKHCRPALIAPDCSKHMPPHRNREGPLANDCLSRWRSHHRWGAGGGNSDGSALDQ